ncbi:MAG TPA: GH92 family glycosyl hydrolase, partial [Bacteroidales bacterium]|nr:GH92 family glycosyl hydrolase [Bacteroidales bacterium]
IQGQNCKAIFTFGKRGKNIVVAKIGISSVSEENARLNLYSEVTAWEFEKLKASAENAWNDYLNKIEVKTDNLENKKTFYTALYHTAISPNIYSDVNGEYRGMDRKVHKATGYDQYTVFSLWDTYRALHPLFTIIEQKRTTDFIKSFLAIYKEAGKLPIWELSGNETDCMIGYHSVSVMSDAINKEISNFDTQYALDAMIASSNKKEYGIDIYTQNGYIPAEKEHESVSKTLEYAYDDWCIARFAQKLGKTDIYNEYIKRAQYYKNNFDFSTGFMRPKIFGKWLEPFSPAEVNVHFTEANSWQYSFYVPQDIETHIKMVGGDEAYSKKLDELFSASNKTTGRTQVDITGLIGQYAHGNEPSHHTAYLYNYTGKPWKSQEMVRQIMTTLYSSAPDGLCGNDDCGQMSAWYVLSALGFYPVTPGDDIYALGSPLFSSVAVNLENGGKFTVNANGNSKENLYINSVTLNGNPYSKSYISHNDIISGSTFNINMSSSPNYNFAVAKADRPHSLITDTPIVINPWFEMENIIFKDSMQLEIKAEPLCRIYYNIQDNSGTKEDFSLYTGPLTIKSNSLICAYSVNDKGEKSFIVTTNLKKVNSELKIKILSRYNPQYNAGGDEGLIDGIRGLLNFRLGGWQGYQDTDFTAIVDLGSPTEINSIGAGFLQDAKSWIWMPKYAEFSISADGVNFDTLGIVYNGIEENDLTLRIMDLVFTPDSKKGKKVARYIKVFAKNIGTIPKWHDGAGGEGFIFIDEIFVR